MRKQSGTYFRIPLVASVFLLMCVSSGAQTEPAKNGSGVEIVKIKWERQLALPRNFDPSTIPENGTFSTLESRTAIPGSTQAPNGDGVRRDAAERSAALAPVDYFPKTPGRMPISYLYSLTLRNVGTGTIRAVAWDYLFLRDGETVVGEHHLLNYTNVPSQRSATLKATQRTRPVTVLTTPADTEAKKGAKPLERAIIQCVLYEDGTIWRNPATAINCDALKKNDPRRKTTTQKSSGK